MHYCLQILVVSSVKIVKTLGIPVVGYPLHYVIICLFCNMQKLWTCINIEL